MPCSGNYQVFETWNLPAGGEGYPLCEKAGIKAFFLIFLVISNLPEQARPARQQTLC
jgi:hypothetical protein